MSVGTASPIARGRAWNSSVTQARSLARPVLLGVAALTVLAAVIRFYRIGHQGFWFDEATSAFLVHFSAGKMLGLLPTSESTPPLYYCIAWVWVRVFGDGEAGLRSLSALAGVATVPVIYAATARLVSTRTGLIAAALTACNPLLIWYSQEARAYELLVLLSAASLLAFSYLLERPTRRSAAVWAIASALALATEYFAILVIVPCALWLLYRHRRSRPVRLAIGAVVLCGLALIPLVLRQEQNGRSKWIARASLARRLKQIVPQFVIGFGSPAYNVLEPLAFALAVFGVVLLLTRRLEHRGALLAGALALAGLVLDLLLVAGGIDDVLTRNVMALWIPAAIVASAGFALGRPRLLGVGAATALCVIGLVAAVGVAQDRNLQRPDWRAVVRLLGTRPTGAAARYGRVVLVQNYKDGLPLTLYLPHLAFIKSHHARASELDIISISKTQRGTFCWWGSACNLLPSRMQNSYPIPGFRPVWRRRVLQFTVLHMVAVAGPVLVRATKLEKILKTTTIHEDGLLYQP